MQGGDGGAGIFDEGGPAEKRRNGRGVGSGFEESEGFAAVRGGAAVSEELKSEDEYSYEDEKENEIPSGCKWPPGNGWGQHDIVQSVKAGGIVGHHSGLSRPPDSNAGKPIEDENEG